MRRSSFAKATLFAGLLLAAVAGSIFGNAYLGGTASSINFYHSPAGNGSFSDSYLIFMKPGDRFIASFMPVNSTMGLNLSVLSLYDRRVQYVQKGSQGLQVMYSPPQRGVYLVEVAANDVNASDGAQLIATWTLTGALPTDILPLGVTTGSGALLLLVLSITVRAFAQADGEAYGVKDVTHIGSKKKRRSLFVTLLSWDLLKMNRAFFALPIFFVIFYSSGSFGPQMLHVDPSKGLGLSAVAHVLVPSLNPENDWNVVFPLIVAMMAFSFSYERDRLVQRTILLNPVKSSTLFLAKYVSVLSCAWIPTVAAITISISMFDTNLVLRNPMTVYGDLWLLLGSYLLMTWVMIGLAILPAVLFRKPIYSFALPLFMYYFFEGQGLGVLQYLPSVAFRSLIGELDSLRAFGEADWGVLVRIEPGIVLALALSVLSFVLFQLEERE